MNREKIKKIKGITFDILLYLFLGICLIMVALTIISKKNEDGVAELWGYQMRIVSSNSMAKCDQTDVSDYEIKSIPLRSMVFVKVMPQDETGAEEWYRDLRVGDVLTFKYVYTSQVTITHRIVSITEKESGGYIIELAGDNRNSNSDQLTQSIDTSIPNNLNYVIGKVTGQAFLLGFVVSLLKSTLGIIFIVIVPSLIVIFMEILKIVGLYQAERKKREQDEKDVEIEALRRQLAQLKNQQNGRKEMG